MKVLEIKLQKKDNLVEEMRKGNRNTLLDFASEETALAGDSLNKLLSESRASWKEENEKDQTMDEIEGISPTGLEKAFPFKESALVYSISKHKREITHLKSKLYEINKMYSDREEEFFSKMQSERTEKEQIRQSYMQKCEIMQKEIAQLSDMKGQLEKESVSHASFLEKRIAMLEEDRNRQAGTNEGLHEYVKEKEAHLKSILAENVNLTESVADLRNHLQKQEQQMTFELEMKQKAIGDLVETKEFLEAELRSKVLDEELIKSLENRIRDLTVRSEASELKNETLEKDLKGHKEALVALNEEREQEQELMNETLAQLRAVIDEQEKSRTSLISVKDKKIAEQIAKMSGLKEELEKLRKNERTLRKKANQDENALRGKNKEIDELNNAVNSLRTMISQFEKNDKTSNSEIARQKEEVKKLKLSLSASNEQVNVLRKEGSAEFSEKINALYQKCDTLRGELVEAKKDSAAKLQKEKNSFLKRAKTELMSEISKYTSKSKVQREKQELKVKQLEEKNAVMFKEFTRQEMKLQELSNVLAREGQNARELEKTLAQNRVENAQLKHQCDERSPTILILEDKIQSLTKQTQILSSVNSHACETVQSKIHELIKINEGLREEKISTDARLNEIEKLYNQLHSEASTLQRELDAQQTEVEMLRSRNSDTGAERDSLKLELSALVSAEADEMRDIREVVRKLKRENRALENKNEKYKSYFDNLQDHEAVVNDKQDRIEKLIKQRSSKENEDTRLLKSKVSALEGQLYQSKLKHLTEVKRMDAEIKRYQSTINMLKGEVKLHRHKLSNENVPKKLVTTFRTSRAAEAEASIDEVEKLLSKCKKTISSFPGKKKLIGNLQRAQDLSKSLATLLDSNFAGSEDVQKDTSSMDSFAGPTEIEMNEPAAIYAGPLEYEIGMSPEKDYSFTSCSVQNDDGLSDVDKWSSRRREISPAAAGQRSFRSVSPRRFSGNSDSLSSHEMSKRYIQGELEALDKHMTGYPRHR
eukprot:Nk52_evm64s352 gene=Nk52_evmTU64s352